MVSLPSDLLLSIFYYCTTTELAILTSTCRLFHSLVEEFAWQAYLRRHPRPTRSLVFSDPKAQVQHNHQCDLNWSTKSFQARPIAKPWPHRSRPAITMNDEFLVIAAGSQLSIYRFRGEGGLRLILEKILPGPAVGRPATSTVSDDDGPVIRSDDITSLKFQGNNLLLVGRQYGSLEAFDIHNLSTRLEIKQEGTTDLHTGALIESIVSSDAGSAAMSLSSNGCATLFSSSESSVKLQSRSWIAHLSSDLTFAAFGTTSSTPLAVYPIMPTGLASRPSAKLNRRLAGSSKSAVYAISNAPPCSSWGASPQVLASGWYDGYVRIFDLRKAGPHLPVYSTHDPWCPESVYSLAVGGGSGCHIGAGLALHSVVAFWDIRARPELGWSVHPPGNDPSPVYDLIMEGSRLWGLTERRTFIFDFDLQERRLEEGWPALERVRGDGVKVARKGSRFGQFYVTLYDHQAGAPTSREDLDRPCQSGKKW